MTAKLGQLAKAFVVLLCLISWLEITNHCALASLASTPHEAESCCTKSEKKQPASTACCQTLQTTEQASISVPLQSVVPLPDVMFSFIDLILPVADETLAGRIHMGDPPGVRLASCLDLERCHPAFAPPYFS
ncbi:MAG: hypothetical protein ABIT76_01660 [Chthoniobacterales bacterium]